MHELTWTNVPSEWEVGSRQLSIGCGAEQDWFHDPAGAPPKQDAPIALFSPVAKNFILQAKVEVDFAEKYDAGVLFVYAGQERWAKLCFEFSSFREPTVVSVVTRGRSDDSNSVVINRGAVHFRVSRNGRTFAFHYATAATRWNLVRYFEIGETDVVRAGFSAQSPIGLGCRARFSEIDYRLDATVEDIRNGG